MSCSGEVVEGEEQPKKVQSTDQGGQEGCKREGEAIG